jgi:uncharacterized membrane protein
MNFSFRDHSRRFSFEVVSLLLLLALTALLLLAPPDGIERGPLLQFVGRFHPLAVHFPIAVLLLVPLFEILGRKRDIPFLLASVDLLLLVVICGAITAAALGWCLARGGGYSGPLVWQHMWGGVSVGFAAWLCRWQRSRANSPAPARVYGILLAAAVGLVSFTGYRGGQLSHGTNHLTQFMPLPLRKVLRVSGLENNGVKLAEESPSTFYGARIHPLFEGHCVTCHGQSKHKAGLRLDSYAAAMRGGKHGPVIKPGDLKESELFRRITLPSTDDDFMPADHKRPLSASDVKLIEAWISSGASHTLAADAIAAVPPSSGKQTTIAEVSFPEIDPNAVAKERAASAPIVSQIQLRLPNIVDYRSRTSAEVVVNASWRGSKFGDNDLAALAALSEWIVAADFSGTGITDRSARAIAGMKKLRQLRLAHTAITDNTIQELGSLDQLESLSVFDTRVTASSLATFARLSKLQHIYAGETKIPHGSAIPAQVKDKLVY